MQFEIKIKVICATNSNYCHCSNVDNSLTIGPLPKELNDGRMNAMDYYHMRNAYLSKTEKHSTILGFKEKHEDGLAILDKLLGLSKDPSVYMDWRGIRRGKYYQIMLYVFIMGDTQYIYYVESIQQILKSNEITVKSESHEVDNSNIHIKSNGCFEIDSHFQNDYINYNRPRCKYYRFFRDESELYTLEKHTCGFEWASWDKDLPSEGDGDFDTNLILSLLSLIISAFSCGVPLLSAAIENHIRKKYQADIIAKYGIDGRLELVSKTSMNWLRRPIYVFQDRRGDIVFAEFEVDTKTGKIYKYPPNHSRSY